MGQFLVYFSVGVVVAAAAAAFFLLFKFVVYFKNLKFCHLLSRRYLAWRIIL
jgi:hypothetical protein